MRRKCHRVILVSLTVVYVIAALILFAILPGSVDELKAMFKIMKRDPFANVPRQYYTIPSVTTRDFTRSSVTTQDYARHSVTKRDYTRSSVTMRDFTRPSVITRNYTRPSVIMRERMDPTLLPSHSNDSALYLDPSNPWQDRIITQLRYVPEVPPTVTKTMLVPGRGPYGEEHFQSIKCKVTKCSVTRDPSDVFTVDLVFLGETRAEAVRKQVGQILRQSKRRPPGQIWVSFKDESPYHSRKQYGGMEFNWTAAYSPWSTIPVPCGEVYPLTADVTTLPQTRNYAANKTFKVLWFVSNCRTPNKRLDYAKELSKYIQVDIFGKCGKRECPQYLSKCMEDMVSKYKFYLGFENSDCDSYVTEKYFNATLIYDILPVVMGALPRYYATFGIPGSYIHVDDYESPAALARYLHILDKNDTLYNSYFRWKGAWGHVRDAEREDGMMCRLCAMLHAPRRTIINNHTMWANDEHCRKPPYRL